jgi:hypothetical protein
MSKIALVLAWAAVLGLAACGGKTKGDEDALGDTAVPDVADDDAGGDAVDDGVPTDSEDDSALDAPDAPADAPADTEEEPIPGDLHFRSIRCLPDVDGGEDVVAGQSMFCRFEVWGTAGRRATLTCEDASGAPIDCSSSSSTQIQPFGSNPLPVINGWFGTSTSGLAGTTIVIVWVADDTVETATHRFEADVVADDGVNGPPSIEVECEGDSDGNVDVTAGDRLDCRLVILDPDPDTVDWDYTQTSGPTPATSPSPYSGLGPAPFDVTWRWQTASTDAGTYVFRFSADDGTAAAVTFDLTVNVS